jgi:hypothetical protein
MRSRSRRSSKAHFVLAATLVLSSAGCSTTGGLVASFEDLSTESTKEGFWKVPQYRVISVPGLLPFADVGGLYFYKPKRKPASAVGLSPGGKSFILVDEVPASCELDCLYPLRDQLVELQTQALKLIEARISFTTLQYAPKPTDEAGLQAYTKRLEEAETEYFSARDTSRKLEQRIATMLKSNGVILYRWTSDNKKGGSAGLGDLFGGSYRSAKRQNGFALVSGLRFATLFVGKDMATAWPDLDKDSRYRNRFELTTSVAQAKHIVYGSEADIESVLDARLAGSYAQLANIPAAIKELDKIELKAMQAKLSSLSNMGVISAPTRRATEVEWNSDFNRNLFEKNGWNTFYSVKSAFVDLIDLVKGDVADAPAAVANANTVSSAPALKGEASDR